MRVIRPRDREYDKLLKTLNRRYKPDQEVRATVATILESVAREGDDALVRFTREFGGPRLDARALGVKTNSMRPRAALSKDVRKAILSAKSNVRAFAKRGLRKNWFTKNRQGAIVGERFDPFQRVGIYVPGGTAPLVSTAVMTCTLAAAAGVAEIVAVTPPARDGSLQPALLGALAECGADGSLRVGGAQQLPLWLSGPRQSGRSKRSSVRAMPTWWKQRQVFGHVAIDLLPGPSEILVIADDSANPEWIAADLLAQSEHGQGSVAILLTTSPRLLEKVADSMLRQRRLSARSKELGLAMKNTSLVLVVIWKLRWRSQINFPRSTWPLLRRIPGKSPPGSRLQAQFSWAEFRRW